MSRPLRLLLTATLALTLLLSAALGAIAILVGSEAGTRFLAGTARDLSGGMVQWDRIGGTLLGPLRIEGLQFRQPGLELSAGEIELAWRPGALLGGWVSVDSLTIDDIRVVLSPAPESPESAPFDPGAVDLPIGIDLAEAVLTGLEINQGGSPPQRVERVELSARVRGDEVAMRQLAVRLPAGGLSANGRVELATAMPLELEVSWDWLLAETGDPAAGTVALDGELQWGQQIGFDLAYRLSASGLDVIDGNLPPRLELTGVARGAQSASDLRIDTFDLAMADTELALSLSGLLAALDTDAPRAELVLQWNGLQWPLQGDDPQFSSPRGELHLDGAPAGFDLALNGEVLGGSLTASGDAALEPAINWRLGLEGLDLDPARLQPDLPGSLAFTLRTQGEIDPAGNPRIGVSLEELRGVLAGRPLLANAEVSVEGESIDITFAHLASRDNSLQASGKLTAERMAIDFRAAVPNPDALLPGAGGELAAAGTLSGSIEAPYLQARVTGDGLQLETLRIATLTSTVSAGPARDDPLALDLAIGPVVDGEQPLLQGVELTATGTTGQHQLAAAIDTGEFQLRTRLAGSPDEAFAAWSGVLQDLSLVSAGYGQWDLQGSPAVALAADRASLDDACLQSTTGAGSLCGSGAWTGEGASEFRGQLQALPLELFVPAVSGAIDGTLSAALAATGEIRVDGELTLSAGEIRVDKSKTLAHEGGRLGLKVDGAGLLAQLQIKPPARGRLEAQARLPALTALPLAEVQPLDGSLTAELPDLSGFAAWVPELGKTAGRLQADLQLAGSLADPQLAGHLVLREGAATIPLAGLELADIELKAASDGSEPGLLLLSGGLRSGPGHITLKGRADIEGSQLELDVVGNRLQVYNTPDAKALLSPDVRVAWQDSTLKLRGTVTVPQADITPQIRLSPAAGDQPEQQAPGEPIAPSPDVVVLDDNLDLLPAEQATAAPFRIDSQLRLEMGDKVRVSAVGLVSRITGAVDFTNTPDQEALIPLANGRFSLEDGTFRAFGQDLEIETGQLIFANVPADQPEINLRAVRWIDNDPQVTAAGVQVTGPLDQPVLELFSRPQLDSSEIQSYLLTGRSPRSRDSVLGIGTYVTRRVYVGYGYNMLEETSEFNSLFNISPRYGLGSSVGEADNNINMTFTYEH